MKKHQRMLTVIGLLLVCTQFTPRASGFTQSGIGVGFANVVPMGHEWITRRAAIELLTPGADPVLREDPNDPRKKWTMGLAKNLELNDPDAQAEKKRIMSLPSSDTRYRSTYQPIFDAIIGERWVDVGGFNVTGAKYGPWLNCWDAVAQQPPEIQEDHYMRKPDEVGGKGGADAAYNAAYIRFVLHFVHAATAPPQRILVSDGGGYAAQVEVDLNYFLFGRALHLLQDSFSSEHTVRISDDNYTTVRQVKSYLCATGSEQHTHSDAATFAYTSGDVIWLPGTQVSGTDWPAYKASNMKATALVAMEATKDCWAAFIRTMGARNDRNQRDRARSEAEKIASRWISYKTYDDVKGWYENREHRGPTYVQMPGESGPGQTQAQCMASLPGGKDKSQKSLIAELQKAQRKCLFNVQPVDGYADRFDSFIYMPYNWAWKDITTLLDPKPAEWTIPWIENNLWQPAQYYNDKMIRTPGDKRWMTAKLENNAQIGLSAPFAFSYPPDVLRLSMARVNDDSQKNTYYFRAQFAPSLFLSYTDSDGTVKLWSGTRDSAYKIVNLEDWRTTLDFGYSLAIWNTKRKQYMWVDGAVVRITPQGQKENENAQWNFTH